jgi:PIN domain nuclease of toxin-antitoxin system
LWEIAIKKSLGKIDLQGQIVDLVPEAVSLLPILPQHVDQVQHLPFYHKDPFDRMLIAQALVEQIPLVSCNEQFAQYPAVLVNY